jgi:hypothetical protein
MRVWMRILALGPLGLLGCGGPKDSGGAANEAVGGPSAAQTADGRWRVAYSADPAPLPFNEPFTLDWAVEALDGSAPAEVLYVDLWMPEHQHGGATLPTTTATGADGEAMSFRTTDLQLHMPGDWQIQVRVDGGGETDAVDLPYRCCEGYAD